MPKLLIVTTIAATLEAFLLPYAEHFRQLGWTVDALAKGANTNATCRKAFTQCHEVAFSRRPWELRDVAALCRNIRGLVQTEGYDIVHVHTPVASFITRLALNPLRKRLQKPRVIYTVHGFHFFRGGGPLKNMVFATAERLAGHWTDYMIVINKEDYEAALTKKIMTAEKLSLLPGIGLDLKRYDRQNFTADYIASVRRELGLTANDTLFLMAAEFNPGKHHETAIKALAQTGRKDIHLALAGAGPCEEAVKSLADELNVRSQVHFLGYRKDLQRLMLASRATILPSEREGLNRSVMESICLGVPVLGADARGVRDLITAPDRGAVFPVRDSSRLATLMCAAADVPNYDRPQPDPAWSVDHLLKEHEEIYRKVLQA